jgi:hypothetical protein
VGLLHRARTGQRRGELLRRLFSPLRRPLEELDRDRLREFCASRTDVTAIEAVQPRQRVRVAGEVSSLRIVPRAGSPSLEVTMTDGSGYLTAVFWGRRRIGGIRPGRRILFDGTAAPAGHTFLIINPMYELLA